MYVNNLINSSKIDNLRPMVEFRKRLIASSISHYPLLYYAELSIEIYKLWLHEYFLYNDF